MVPRRPLVDRRGAAAMAVLVAGVAAAGCTDDDPAPPTASSEQTSPPSSSPSETPTQTPTETSTDTATCFPDAIPVPVPLELNPLPFPDRTRVYDVEERGDNGIMVSGVTTVLYNAAVFQMRERYAEPPFAIVGFDEAESAVGANWTGAGISGRWVVADIDPVCPGDTEVMILWTPAGGLPD